MENINQIKNVQKVLVVGVNLNDDYYFYKSINELEELVKACNMMCVGRVTQNLDKINSTFYVGNGKIDEINEKIQELNVDVVVFNNELTPSQFRNISSKLKVEILDRTGVILEIFAKRAKTKEARIQVEVANLKYMLPRLKGLHSNLGRQGAGAGLSNKGSGEKKIELDRRTIESRINKLENEIKEIEVSRKAQRRKRDESATFLVSLVGYTNAGKSTLMNSMIDIFSLKDDKKVYEEDMLFATLDTSIRNIKTQDGKEFLLSDTVGFIRELPSELIKAFRTTLDEVKSADLLLHVIDLSDDEYEENINVTNNTLKEIGADNIPVIYVFNKAELVKDKLPIVKDDKIYISAKEKIGINELTDLIIKKAFENYITCKMKIPFNRSSIISYLKDKYSFNHIEYVEDGTVIILECSRSDYNKYVEYVVE